MTIRKFQETILDWYKENRRDLSWRRTKDPYKILVSEIMLQQTQISRVLPKYKEFLKEFPTIEILAKSSDTNLLKVWSGLGYWRRAKYLKETAKIILKKYKGKFPKESDLLKTLPGIGPYTARALACFAFGSREAFVDTNIRRVYLHFFFPSTRSARSSPRGSRLSRAGQVPQKISDKEILKVAQKTIDTLPKGITPREWHYALFDYGATILKDKTINRRSRHYHKQSKFEGSFRSYRTKVVRFLLSQQRNRTTHQQLKSFLKKELNKNKSPYKSGEIIKALLKDKLIKKSQKYYSL